MKTHITTLRSCVALLAAVATLFIAPLRAQAADTVYVATYFEVRPASTAAGAALVREYERASRAEAGNPTLTALQEIGRPSRFVVIESWANQAAFATHDKSPATLAFRDKLSAIQSSPHDQRVNSGFVVDPQSAANAARAVYVVTHVDVPGARREEAEKLLVQLAEASRKDSGHLRYDVYQQVDPRTNHFTVFAAWDSQRAFETSGVTPHALQFRTALGPMLGALYDERLYRLLGAK